MFVILTAQLLALCQLGYNPMPCPCSYQPQRPWAGFSEADGGFGSLWFFRGLLEVT